MLDATLTTCHNVTEDRSKLTVFYNRTGSGCRVTRHFSTSTLTLQDMVMIGPQKDVAIILDVFGACRATCDPQLGPASCTGANHKFKANALSKFRHEILEEVLFFSGFHEKTA